MCLKTILKYIKKPKELKSKKMKIKKTLENEINEVLTMLETQSFYQMFCLMFETFQLFDVDEDEDWVKDAISNKSEVSEIRLLKSVHLISKMAELYAGKLVLIKTCFPKLYLRMEEQAKQP